MTIFNAAASLQLHCKFRIAPSCKLVRQILRRPWPFLQSFWVCRCSTRPSTNNMKVTCSFETWIGFLKTVQITLSNKGGVVRDPSYLQNSSGALESLCGNSLAGSTFSSSEKEILSPLFGIKQSLLQIFSNSRCFDPTCEVVESYINEIRDFFGD